MADFTVTVVNSKGFHLRPASKLLQLASDFDGAQIIIRHEASGRTADCRNMMALMMMSSPKGTVFHVEITADQAVSDQARQAITALFEQGFGDEL